MKKVLFMIMIAFAIVANAQTVEDSTEITVSLQARDVEYIYAYIFANEQLGNLTDSIKPAYRKLVNPGVTTAVVVKGYTKDFLEVLRIVRNDALAIKNKTAERVENVLLVLNVPYITSKITAFQDADNSQFVAARKYGKFKITRKLQ